MKQSLTKLSAVVSFEIFCSKRREKRDKRGSQARIKSSFTSSQCRIYIMEIMGIERWDSFVEFLDDIKDEYYYNQVRKSGGKYLDR